MLHQDIKETLTRAMKAHDVVRLRTVRGMLTAFTNELVVIGKKPQDLLDDEGVLTVIRRLTKQRKESIAQFDAAGRTDLSEGEKAELAILESYLPQMMARDEIRPLALAKKAELGITERAKMGLLMGSLMKDLGGKADGGDVKAVVEEILS